MLGDIEDINPFNLSRIVIDLQPKEWDGNASKRIVNEIKNGT